jgi:DNA-binding Xre family transcriptional regulator
MVNMAIHWKLDDVLRRHNISPYRLIKASGLAQGTVYRMVNGEAKGVDTITLDACIKALCQLTGKQISVADLLEYHEGRDDNA